MLESNRSSVIAELHAAADHLERAVHLTASPQGALDWEYLVAIAARIRQNLTQITTSYEPADLAVPLSPVFDEPEDLLIALAGNPQPAAR